MLSIKFQRSSYSINVNWDITSVFDPNGIYLIVRDRNNAEFTTPQISDGTPSQCINSLEPDTDYSLTVTAVFNCYNISETVDFTTLGAGSSSSNLPSQDCIMYRPQVGFPSKFLYLNYAPILKLKAPMGSFTGVTGTLADCCVCVT